MLENKIIENTNLKKSEKNQKKIQSNKKYKKKIFSYLLSIIN